MASIEYRGSSYRIIFRYAGEKFSRSLKTDNLKSANASRQVSESVAVGCRS